jgi:hypothetical protein
MESTTPNITLENIREFLKNKNLMIDKKEQYLELEKKC